jgi:hypothetical protein
MVEGDKKIKSISISYHNLLPLFEIDIFNMKQLPVNEMLKGMDEEREHIVEIKVKDTKFDYDKVVWAWEDPKDSECNGPFNSREEAIQDAKINSENSEVLIGHVKYPKPSDFISIDMDSMLEDMDMMAADNCYYSTDGPIFEVNSEEAKNELDQLLKDWADKWIEPQYWTFEEVEKVKWIKEK